MYKSLQGRVWNLGDFNLEVLHAQGDPFASPSRLCLTAPLASLGFRAEHWDNPIRCKALADFLQRKFQQALSTRSSKMGDGTGGQLLCATPGPEILERNSARIEDGEIRLLCNAGLPGNGRRVAADMAAALLLQILPDALTEALYADNAGLLAAEKHIQTAEIATELRSALVPAGLVAFVCDGAVLPRTSPLDASPMPGAKVFQAPEGSLCVELEAGGKRWRGMGIPQGITLLAGGAYHGKSTLLSAIREGVWNHIPGDGRERVVSDPNAFLVRTEEGRSVRDSDISSLVHDLPGGSVSQKFRTQSASGSTSQAANLVEAIALGTRVLLIDEDQSAVNFLIRDQRMRELVGEDSDPLVPLVDRIRSFAEQGISFVIVVGACGDYLNVADQVVVLDHYQPCDASAKARQIADRTSRSTAVDSTDRSAPVLAQELRFYPDDSIQEALRPRGPEKRPKIRTSEPGQLQIGTLRLRLQFLAGLAHTDQLRAIGQHLLPMLRSGESQLLPSALPSGLARGDALDMAEVRALEVGAALLRVAPPL